MPNPFRLDVDFTPASKMIAHETIIERAEERWKGNSPHLIERVEQMLTPQPCWLIVTIQGHDTCLVGHRDAIICWDENGETQFWKHPNNPHDVTIINKTKYSASIYEAIEAFLLWAESEDKFWPICECDRCQNTTTSSAVNTLLNPEWGEANRRYCPF